MSKFGSAASQFVYALSSHSSSHPAAVLELGALFGALAAGTFADRYSRRHSILVASSTRFLPRTVSQFNKWLRKQSHFALVPLSNVVPNHLTTFS
jgi:MFS family permease